MQKNHISGMEDKHFFRAEAYLSVIKTLQEIYYSYDFAQDCMTVFLEGIQEYDRDLILPAFYSARAWRQYLSPQDEVRYTAFLKNIERDLCSASLYIQWGTEFDFLWYEISGMPVLDGGGKIEKIVGRISEKTGEKKAYDELVRRARTDSMTGLLNKAAFEKQCRNVLANAAMGEQFALLIIDINGLKTFNDNFGHLYGDRVINFVAAAVSSLFQDYGIAGRIGGDEIAVLMGYSRKCAVVDRLEALHDYIKGQHSETEFPVSVSTGAAYFREDGLTYKELFLKADREMYFTKDMKITPPDFSDADLI